MLAGSTPDEDAAYSTIRGAAGNYQPYFDQASNYLTAGNQDIASQLPEFNEANLSKYYNPYENDVVNSTLGDLRRANADQQSDLTGSAVKAGAWGGSGAEDARNNLAGSQANNTATTIANLRNTGFNTAAGLFDTDRSTQLQALLAQRSNSLNSAGIAAGMGNSASDNTLKQASAQLGAGVQQQGEAQEELNIPYQQFQQQQAYPYQQLQYLTNLISAVSGGAGGTSTSTQAAPQSNGLSDILGLAGTVASFFKDGGRVRKAGGGGIAGMGSYPSAEQYGIPGVDLSAFLKASLGAPAAPSASAQPAGADDMGGWMSLMKGINGMGGAGGLFPTEAGASDAARAAGITFNQSAPVGEMFGPFNGGGFAKGGSVSAKDRFLMDHDDITGPPLYDPNSSGDVHDSSAPVPRQIIKTPMMPMHQSQAYALLKHLSPSEQSRLVDYVDHPLNDDQQRLLQSAKSNTPLSSEYIDNMFGSGYAAGGGVVDDNAALPAGIGSTAIQTGFSKSVPGTPVYSFNPLDAAARGVTIPSRLPTPAPAAAPAKTNTAALQMPMFMPMAPNENEATYNQRLGDYSRAMEKYQSDNSESDNPFQFQMFAKGGRVRRAGGGGIAGMPYANMSPVFVPGQAPQMPDFGASYIPDAGGFGHASMSAPHAPDPADGLKPFQEDQLASIGNMIKNAGGAMTASPTSGAQFGPPIPASLKDGPPAPAGLGIAGGAAASPATSSGGGFSDRLNAIMSDPARLALLMGSASMIGNRGASLSQNIGEGLRSGITAFASATAQKRDAQAKANQLMLEIEKQKDLEDYRQKKLDQPEYVSLPDSPTVASMDKRSGKIMDTGVPSKTSMKNVPELSAKSLNQIEDNALGLFQGAFTTDAKGKSQMNPAIYDSVPNRADALKAAGDAYQKTKSSNAAMQAYLDAAGIDPGSNQFDAGADNSMVGRMMGYDADRPAGFVKKAAAAAQQVPGKTQAPSVQGPTAGAGDAVLAQARGAIAKGAPRSAVAQRLKDNGIDPAGL